MGLKYKRVLIKISGEALAGPKGVGLDFNIITPICESIKKCTELGAEVAIVVGGGNFWRGRSSGNMDRTRADHMGMLATIINAIAVGDTLEQMGVNARVQTAISMPEIAELFIKGRATRHLEKGRVVIFGGGIGRPCFSTDTAAVLRAAEIDADVVLLAKNIDGVYTADPEKDPTATKFDEISFDEIYARNLKIMDMTAFTLCKENGLNIIVFDMDTPGNLMKVLRGENIGTLVHK
mgnify:CR=1 FL=1